MSSSEMWTVWPLLWARSHPCRASSTGRMLAANAANVLTIAAGPSLDILNYILGEFADLSAVSDLRRPLVRIEATGQRVMKTAADQIAVVGTLASGATAIVHIREAVAGGTGFLWEINGTDGTLRITADAAYPEIFPLTVAGAHGSDGLIELAVPAGLTQKWPSLSGLEGSPADNVGRAYAAFAEDIDNGTIPCRILPTRSGATSSSPPSRDPRHQASA